MGVATHVLFLNFKKKCAKKIGSGLGFDLFFGNDFGGGDSFLGQRRGGFGGKCFVYGESFFLAVAWVVGERPSCKGIAILFT